MANATAPPIADASAPPLTGRCASMPLLNDTPAMVRTATWDIVAWNAAASAVLVEFGSLRRAERNMLRMMFCDERVRAAQFDWESVARFLVSGFRIDAARGGAAAEIGPLVSELCVLSPELAALWREHDLPITHSDGIKRLRHPVVGTMALEFSIFAMDGRPDLQLVVLNPVSAVDRERVRSLTKKVKRKTRSA